nr:hypothetical protein [uncultured Mediterranean phage uvMED]
MARHHNINGKIVPFTAEEEAQRDQEEANWEAGAFDRAIADLRQRRNSLLSATDFYALSDNTMSADMTTYRQELRDITEGLTTVEEVEAVEFPSKP